jgi:hypothetical protein
MAEKANTAALPGVHPTEVAKLFGVHLRTVFRWIARGFLRSDRGLVNGNDIAERMSAWEASYSLGEARTKLRVSPGTMIAWRKKKVLKKVVVLGIERVTKKSVDALIDRPARRLFLVKRGYARKHRALVSFGIGAVGLEKAMRRNLIPSKIVDGERLLREKSLRKLESAWRASCYPIDARRILRVSKERLPRLIQEGRVRETTIIGRRRILLEGLARTKDEELRLERYLAREARKFERRKNAGIEGHRRKKEKKAKLEAAETKRREGEARKAERARAAAEAKAARAKLRKDAEARKKAEKGKARFRAPRLWGAKPNGNGHKPAPLPDYAPQPVVVRGYESRRLTTCEEVAKALGKSVEFVKQKYVAGTLRGMEPEPGKIYVYLASAEVLIQRARQGIH